jgi:hypothetical protein
MDHPTPSSGAGEDTGVAPDHGSPPRMPGWVKWSAIVIGILIVVFVVLQLTGLGGEHGPGRHKSPGGAGAPSVSVIEAGPAGGHAPLASSRG